MKKVLIISAHADDETFGMGGTICSLASHPDKYSIYWLILSSIWEPKWTKHEIDSREKAIKTIYDECGMTGLVKWEYRDNLLDRIPINELQERMIAEFDRIEPNIIFTPSIWDFNFEHKLAFELVEMSSKPYYSKYIEQIIAYEIPSSTESSFDIVKKFPVNLYVNIEPYIDSKIKLVNNYESELHQFPHPRSEKYLRSLSEIRGAEAGMNNAEAFSILRKIIS